MKTTSETTTTQTTTTQKEMPKLILYGVDISPPVRTCKLTLAALDLPYEYKLLNLFAGEQRTPEFIRRNPLQTVPVLKDEGNFIGDSSAICAYLVDKYAKDDKLYPKDLVQRALVNQRLFFNASILFMSMRNISIPLFTKATTIITKEKVNNVLHSYEMLESLLGDNDFVAGADLTIADLACAPIVLSEQGFVDIDPQRFPKVLAWLARVSKTLPFFEEINTPPTKEYISMLKSMITEIEL